MALRILRILLYVQFLLGLLLYVGPRFGISLNRGVGDTHELFGIIIFVLAIWALRPVPGVPNTGVRVAARFISILPLALGIGFAMNAIPGGPIVGLHMLLGLTTIALVEMASGQARRAARRAGGFAAS
jgi:hypothetical protein